MSVLQPPKKGWIVTEQTTILYTENGGDTWRVQFTGEDFILKSISFCDEIHGWAVGEYGYVYHTKDGGMTWELQAGYFGFSEETGEIEGGNYLFSVITLDPNTAWVCGIDGYVAKTGDGGATWQSVTGGVPQTHLYTVNTDGNGRIVIGGAGILSVLNANDHKFIRSQAQPSVEYGWMYGIDTRGDAGFVGVGGGGRIYITDGMAESWQQARITRP